jgi:DNA (cytosine-5)-methyltransferase 1
MQSNANSRPMAIDLFSGCGGLTLGLKRAGFKVVAAVEKEELATKTYRQNYPRTLLVGMDIRDVDIPRLKADLGLRRGELALLAGCPPCQGFSRLRTLNGRWQIEDPMNELVFVMLPFIEAFHPKAVMIENVPGLADDGRMNMFSSALADLGYTFDVGVFNASDYGVAQRRRRMILVGTRYGTTAFADPVPRKRTVRAAIGMLPMPGSSGDPLHDYRVNRAPHVMKLIKKIPKDGGSRADLPADKQLACHRNCDGFRDIYGRMSWSELSPTITGGCINPSKGRFLHPDQDRAITLREAAMLQGFPKSYFFDMSKGLYPAAQMIGNAFPPKFAEHHARKVLEMIQGR